jgi:hypothetical protein
MDFERIDKGVEARIALGVPNDQIDAWIQSQGWSPDMYKTVALEGGSAMNAARTFGQGVTLGWGDELEAGVRSVLPESMAGAPYEQGLKDARRGLAAFDTKHPVMGSALQVAGGLAPALLTMGTSAPATLPGAIAQGIGLGGLSGGIAGAGSADGDMQSRLVGAGVGAGVGGILGGITGGAARGIGDALTGSARRADMLSGRSLIEDGAPAELIAGGAGGRVAVDRFAEQAASKPLTAAEVAGPGSVQRMVSALAKAGPESSDLARRLEERQRTSFERIAGDLERFLPETSRGTLRAQAREEAAASAPRVTEAYGRAYQVPISTMPETAAAFVDEVSTPIGRKAWNYARMLAAQDKKKLPEIFVKAEDGSTVPDPAATIDMESLDYFKRGIDQIIEKSVTQEPATQRVKLDATGRLAQRMKRKILSQADTENPDYAMARGLHQDSAEFRAAMEMGQNIVARGSRSTEAADLVEDLAQMSEPERMAYRLGAVAALRRQMGDLTGPFVDRAKVALSPNMTEKLRAIEATPGAADRLLDALRSESAMTRTTQVALSNSKTGSVLAQQQEMASDPVSAAVDLISPGGSTTGYMTRMIDAVLGSVRDFRKVGALKRTAGGVARNLGAMGEQEIRDMLAGLQRTASGRQIYPNTAPIPMLSGGSGGLLSNQ